MIKNIAQSIIYGLAAVLIGMTPNTTFPVILLVIGAVVAAFESSRFLSATEVGLTTIAIICAIRGWWVVSIVLLVVLVAENLAFVLAPIRLRLMQMDQKQSSVHEMGEG